MYYKGTQKQCKDYNDFVVRGEKYQSSTNSWADVIRNNNGQGFAILKHEKYESNMQEIEKIPDGWRNKEKL